MDGIEGTKITMIILKRYNIYTIIINYNYILIISTITDLMKKQFFKEKKTINIQ